MPERFFLATGSVDRGSVAIDGRLAQHIAASLRMRPGDAIVAVDEHGLEHGVRLRSVVRERVEGEVTWSRPATGEPQLRITVVQALPRERMEDCIDILVEAGAAEIRPAVTERVVSRAGGDRLATRVQRWQAIAAESAQLAGRGMIPRVLAPVSLSDALASLPPGARVLACTFPAPDAIADVTVDAVRPLALCIGPEGGFGDRDIDALHDAEAEYVHIGARVMRTRYAGAVACAVLLGRSGDLTLAASPPPS